MELRAKEGQLAYRADVNYRIIDPTSTKPLSAAQDPGLKIEHQGFRMTLVLG